MRGNKFVIQVFCKNERPMVLYVSRFSPEVMTLYIENSLKEQLRLENFVCTILKTKFSGYFSFHVSVNVDAFPLINNTGVWPNVYLNALFMVDSILRT